MTGNLDDIFHVEGCDTLPKLFRHRVAQLDGKVALREKDLGIWQAITWAEYGRRARQIGLGLISLGLEKGDICSILSDNNKEWLFTDLGVQGVGGVASGVYTTDSAKQLVYLVNDSQSKFLFVENEEQLDKLLEKRDEMPSLIKVFIYDLEGLRDFDDPMVMGIDDLYEIGDAYGRQHPDVWDSRIDQGRPDDMAILIYTSGTTGPPKGAMISHRNCIAQVNLTNRVLPSGSFDEQLSFLPLCHIAERSFSVLWPLRTGATINFAESPATVPENIREVSPTVFFAVPRVWEKFYSGITIQMKDATRMGRFAYGWALGIGRRAVAYRLQGETPPAWLNALWWLVDKTVFINIKRMMGLDRVRYVVTGAAPIAPDLIRWFLALRINMFELYGQTETTGVVSTNHFTSQKVGTVGPELPGTEVMISPEGEVMARGPLVFMGYLNQPEKTAETINPDGWLHTGDVGEIDNEGFLRITDRMKDIIITAGGKNITPSEIENQMKFSPYISDAVVIGDKRKYLTALVMIDHDNVVKFAQDNDVPFTNYASLCRAKEVQDLIWAEIEQVNANFARVETIKKFRLIDQLLTAEDDELTPTMKLKRKFVNEKYRNLIDSMYVEG